MMRRILVLLSTMVSGVLLASGVALAANIQCLGGPCVGTEESDRIVGSELNDLIEALGGADVVAARGGDDEVYGGAGADDISGGVGGDGVEGGGGPDNIVLGPGTTDASEPPNFYTCTITDESGGIVATSQGTQGSLGGNGNDILVGGPDNDALLGEGGRNNLSGNGGDDCLVLEGAPNERVSGGDGDDIIGTFEDGNGDDVFCGAGTDTVGAEAEDRVAANCENVIVVEETSALQSEGATPEAEVTITM